MHEKQKIHHPRFFSQASSPKFELKQIIKDAPLTKVAKEELIGFSNYKKLAADFVDKKRLTNRRSIHEKVILNKT